MKIADSLSVKVYAFSIKLFVLHCARRKVNTAEVAYVFLSICYCIVNM